MLRRLQPRKVQVAVIAAIFMLFIFMYTKTDVDTRFWYPRQTDDSVDRDLSSISISPNGLLSAAESKTATQNRKPAKNESILKSEDVFQNGQKLEQDDPRLLEFIRANHLRPPSPNPYKLKDPTGDPSAGMGIRAFVHKILGKKKGGFFIECGGLDGEFFSNSLVLERDFGWTGLLVEADPDYIPQLIAKNRKSWFADVCISLNIHPEIVKMQVHGIMGWSVIANKSDNKDFKTIEVKCIPLYSLLAALEVKTVDYFSLDIEGNELKVLKTIPFDKVLIKTVSVETSPERHTELREFMLSKDFRFVKHIKNDGAHDDIFVHNSVQWSESEKEVT